jgi:hypothetical protein
MSQEFIETRGNGYYFIGSRVSLESVIYQFLQGESPEGIFSPILRFRSCRYTARSPGISRIELRSMII